jgi:uncharacterized protein YdaU (DUF1376 family)
MGKTGIWLPLYIGDYLAETTRLSTLQHGAYFLLMLDYWRNGPLPADENVLRKITRMTLKQWRANSQSVLSFFNLDNGKLLHTRLEKELELAEKNVQKTAAARAVKLSKNPVNPDNSTSGVGSADTSTEHVTDSVGGFVNGSVRKPVHWASAETATEQPSPSPSPSSSQTPSQPQPHKKQKTKTSCRRRKRRGGWERPFSRKP